MLILICPLCRRGRLVAELRGLVEITILRLRRGELTYRVCRFLLRLVMARELLPGVLKCCHRMSESLPNLACLFKRGDTLVWKPDSQRTNWVIFLVTKCMDSTSMLYDALFL